ncbi:type IV pilin N-terminal domain-containing protein [Natrarchaeobius chitinivorans]|uniref:type IV pilin N-terminal domain-containing protein n=1 Tax=Natrarchaeobius chitinivorans TaxID=1679083 RepID=UPI000F547E45|nr:type IV pilin N-terminal domain-containing protein [Natrarchaeobius chitinivorans]
MDRRTVLASIGTGTTGFAGCLGALDDSTDCEPSEEETTFDDAMALVDEPGMTAPRISVRGTIVALPTRGLLLEDPTGVARITTGLEYEFDMERLDLGDCVSADVSLNKRSTWDNQMPIVSVRRDHFEKVGTTENAATSRFDDASPPDASFEIDFDSEFGSSTSTVTLTHDGGEPVDAADLFVCHGPEREDARRPTLDQTTTDSWADLAGSTADVTRGDAVSIELTDDTNGTLLWQSGTGWNKQLRGFAV